MREAERRGAPAKTRASRSAAGTSPLAGRPVRGPSARSGTVLSQVFWAVQVIEMVAVAVAVAVMLQVGTVIDEDAMPRAAGCCHLGQAMVVCGRSG